MGISGMEKRNFELRVIGLRVVGIWARPLGPKEIDWLLVPPDKAHTLLTGHLITG